MTSFKFWYSTHTVISQKKKEKTDYKEKKKKNEAKYRSVADLGGGGSVAHPSSQGFDLLPIPPFVLFWLTNFEFFLRALSAPIYTNFEGGARAEIMNFFSKFSKKG